MQLDELPLADAQLLDYVQLGTQLYMLPGSLTQLDSRRSTSPQQLDSLLSSLAVALLDSTALGSRTQLGSLDSLTLLDPTALGSLAQLSSPLDLTALLDSLKQLASLAQLDAQL